MRGNTISIELPLKRGKVSKTIPLYQYDYGQKLIITGAELPEYYEVHFSNEMHGEAVTSIGDSTGVVIPDALLETGENVYLWLYLHADSDDGETEFQGAIPVIKRAKATDQTPTPAEQSVITQAIAALTSATTEATAAKEGAEAAQQHIENMGVAATTLPTGSDATVTKTVNASGEVTLTFGLPRGVKGDRGERGLQGETGNDGEDGTDGFSPVVSLTKSGKVTTFSVTDAEDTHSVEINDGEDGDPTVIIDDTAGEGDTDLTWSADKIVGELGAKYEKPNSGIPATDIADGVIPDPEDLIDDTAGSGDTDKVWSADKSSALLTEINSGTIEENLLRDELPGTSKTVTFDGDGNPSTIVHAENGTTVRTDVFTWTDSSVTEVRTLSSGKYIQIVTNLTTLAQTISAVQEVA